MKLSNTMQRRVIVEELCKLKSHPTADELYELVRQRLPRISLGTVYRNLELLSDAGRILKLQTSGKQKRFDGNTDKHYHLCCRECQAVEDIDLEQLSKIEGILEELIESDWIDGFNLELTGLCQTCRQA